MEKFFPDEYGNVKAENDWVTAQVARYPDRLVGFCGVSPLKDYAVQEVRRCASKLPMKGLKIHFGSSGVDVLNPEHLDKVRLQTNWDWRLSFTRTDTVVLFNSLNLQAWKLLFLQVVLGSFKGYINPCT